MSNARKIGKFLTGERYVLTLERLDEFAYDLAQIIDVGYVVALNGNLGTGKTTLSQKLIRHILPTVREVTSPTFNIVQVYESPNKASIYHYDLYRIKSPRELVEIGLQESINNGLCIIEWPEIASGFLHTSNIISILLEHNDDSTRFMTVTYNWV